MDSIVKFDYQYKRTIMGISSIFLVKQDNLPSIIMESMKILIGKLVEISKKNIENKQKSFN